jgi:hypothetical protein
MEKYHFQQLNYQKQKPFSSFLSGISGLKGIPLWAFYVNRGQLIASFGVKNKNGQIMEFFPANAAYHYVSKVGFRTFIKINNETVECFKEEDLDQTLDVYQDKVSISQLISKFNITVKVTYFTLPNERLASLNRKVEIINHNKENVNVDIVDGLTQILPTGIDFGGYKAVSNLLQSWMESKNTKDYVFYTLRGSTGDEAEVSEITEGHFIHTISNVDNTYIYDYKALFGEDTSLNVPYHLMDGSLKTQKQTHVNQVPCAFSYQTFNGLRPEETVQFVSMFGYVEHEEKLSSLVKKTNINYINEKELENQKLHEEITSVVKTKTNFPIYDAYIKQSYMDNVLRGGYPLQLKVKDGFASYYVYSRKHGDLERDYNFFNLEPAYYSQGNGNFRDVLQNRRNDLIFFPEIKSFNIKMFASFIQDDGYNPLSIEGVTFTYLDQMETYPEAIQTLLKNPYTPGTLLMALEDHGLEQAFKRILEKSKVNFQASFGEGYWEDHFTYLLDLIENFETIYPDQISDLLFNQYVGFYQSNAYVVPRDEKYVLTKHQTVRQFGALKHLDPVDTWLKVGTEELKIPIVGKLMTLILNKFAHLDPYGIGLSYEGNKPGWNDACNGLPGLFGSGVSEMFELKKLANFVYNQLLNAPDQSFTLLKDTAQLLMGLNDMELKDDLSNWDYRMNLLESYRLKRLDRSVETVEIKQELALSILKKILEQLDLSTEKAKQVDEVIPTYLTFEAESYDQILDANKQPIIGHYGLPLVKVNSFKMRPLPSFLEGPARYIKNSNDKEEAYEIYQKVKKTGLYDKKHKFYQTSVSLENESFEIGRLKAFTPGWLERESNFLHMTYKYLLGLLKVGLYETFYKEIKSNYTCFMDPKVYGRSPLEVSSFIATSSNPDPKKHGQGFVARLSGSTAEMLSMYQFMFHGKHIFELKDGNLIYIPKPKLSKTFFKDQKVETTLFGSINVVYENPKNLNTFDDDAYIEKIIVKKDGESKTFNQGFVDGIWANDIREKNVFEIIVYYNKEENR